MQARWPRKQARIEGEAKECVRISGEGEERSFFFCPHCGGTVYYWIAPEHIAVPVGAFADRPSPRRADAERFVEEVRGDDQELARDLRIEERELAGVGGLN